MKVTVNKVLKPRNHVVLAMIKCGKTHSVVHKKQVSRSQLKVDLKNKKNYNDWD
jgi:hypothetical protein